MDTTFGARGKVTTDALDTSDIHALAIQSDGKIIAAGGSQSPGHRSDFGLVRYNDDGSLDTTFGAGGKVTTAFGPWRDRVFALALQPDGRIVAGGDTESAKDRGPPSGSPDITATVRWTQALALVGRSEQTYHQAAGAYLRSLGIQRDGTIVAVGTRGL